MKYAIEARGLSRSFGSTRALDGLDLRVPAGGVYGFLGPNGSGKTTTIRLLLGLLGPGSGTARVLGHDVVAESDRVRTRCGALLEYDGLYERLGAEANLDLIGRIWRFNRRERDARTREILESMGLFERRKDPVGEWSRGMKRTLAVARALYHRPDLVFLDEPTSGLDPVAAAAFVDGLRDLERRGRMTVFLTTHNLTEAEKLCDSVGVLREGRLVAEGSPSEIRALSGGRRVEITVRNPPEGQIRTRLLDDLRAFDGTREVTDTGDRLIVTLDRNVPTFPLVRFLVNSGVQVEEVRKRTATLEEAFLSLVDAGGDEHVA